MINPSFHLYQLQKIDLKIDAKSNRLTEIDKIRKNNSVVLSAEEDLNKKQQLLETGKKDLSLTEEKIKTKKVKMEQSESSLYGGNVKNPKELQDLQFEIESLKTGIDKLEEIQYEQLINIEEKEGLVNNANTALAQINESLKNQFSVLFEEETTLHIEIERLSHERKVVLDQISESNFLMYETLRKKKKGIAVSIIEDNCCSACGSTLTPADCQTAKSPSTMATCQSCGRILYAG